MIQLFSRTIDSVNVCACEKKRQHKHYFLQILRQYQDHSSQDQCPRQRQVQNPNPRPNSNTSSPSQYRKPSWDWTWVPQSWLEHMSIWKHRSGGCLEWKQVTYLSIIKKLLWGRSRVIQKQDFSLLVSNFTLMFLLGYLDNRLKSAISSEHVMFSNFLILTDICPFKLWILLREENKLPFKLAVKTLSKLFTQLDHKVRAQGFWSILI